jgi:bacillithiol system protein YtxJ
MPGITAITAVESWTKLWDEQAAADARVRIVFKQSPRCPISHAMQEAFERFAARLPDAVPVELFRVDVVADREVSLRIAEDTSIRHESPQALFIGPARSILWHASHYSVSESQLEDALRNAGLAPNAS